MLHSAITVEMGSELRRERARLRCNGWGRRASKQGVGMKQAKEEPKPKVTKEADAEKARKTEALKRAVEMIEKQFGNGSIQKLSSDAKKIPAVSTGALTLDIALGVGGIPRGRVIEIFGPE